ncbi:hypothetical protein [Sulfurimonas sp.]|nr:hypothetical protein [Sulfurimonas sp.]
MKKLIILLLTFLFTSNFNGLLGINGKNHSEMDLGLKIQFVIEA